MRRSLMSVGDIIGTVDEVMSALGAGLVFAGIVLILILVVDLRKRKR